MKRLIGFGLVIILLNINYISVYGMNLSENAVQEKKTEINDSISEAVLEKGLCEESKIQKYEDASNGIMATNQVMVDNSIKMTGKEEQLYVDNCVIVKTIQDIAIDTTNVILAVRYDDVYYIQYETVQDAQKAMAVLAQYPSVEYAVTDQIVTLEEVEATEVEAEFPIIGKDGYTHHSWGIIHAGLDMFAEYVSGNTTRSIDIAVVDSGVYSAHPFLQGYISDTQYDLVNNDNVANDTSGHGTLVTGVIVDAMQKLNVNIVPIRVFDGEGNSSKLKIEQGIRRAISEGVDVINLSLRGPINEEHSIVDDAISDAIANDIIVVAAAGNDNNNTNLYCPAHLSTPIVVSGVDKEKHRYTDSNYGNSVDVTAPAVDIKTCAIRSVSSTGYAKASGTSLAAPHVTAAAAMLRLLYPNISQISISNLLRSYTVDFGSAGFDIYFGDGFSRISDAIVTVPFSDVHSSNYYFDGVYSAYGRGYMTGKSNTIFAPTENMKRQDIALTFYRMAGEPDVTYRYIYPDVSSGDYFADAAVWAYDNGIVTGLANGYLGVGDNITREAFAVILCRYATFRGMDTLSFATLSGYTDGNQVSEFAVPALKWAVENGLMGQGVDELNPQDYISRADIAVMIYRFLCL